MLNPSRGPERVVRAGQWAIAALFAWCLIQVSASLIADLPRVSSAPQRDQFRQLAAQQALQTKIAPLQAQNERLQQELKQLSQRREAAAQNLRRERQSFETWRDARATTDQSDQNPEVLRRARQLDAQLAVQRQLEEDQQRLEQRQQDLRRLMAPLEQQSQALELRSERAFEQARSRHEWIAFLIRLGFVLPVLLLGVHLFRRYRGSEQWPFVWGFLLFALFGFFVELVPYLPSFGAYIRYGVGAVLTYLGGRALMRWLRDYLSRKQSEQQAPQEKRLQQIRYEKALQSLSRRQCPSCERTLSSADTGLPDYCMHCGLRIQTHCQACSHHHLAFYPYCPACGTATDLSARFSDQEGAAGSMVARAAVDRSPKP